MCPLWVKCVYTYIMSNNAHLTERLIMSTSPKMKAKALIAKIAKANVKSGKLRVKQVFDHSVFAEQMYKAQASPKLSSNLSARAHAVKFGVVVDQRKVCAKAVTLNDKGVMRPELAVLAIMQTLQKFDKSLVNVGYVRLCVNGTPEASDMNNDDAYKVVLYRK